MSLMQILLREIMLEICEECNYDVRDIKEYLKTTYPVLKNYDFSKDMKKFEKLIAEKTAGIEKNDKIKEFIEKFGVQINDN